VVELSSWNDGATRSAIVDFVTRVTDERSDAFVVPDERIAVFDNDGTLWCEKPMPIELGFILERFAAMVESDATLRERQPWKAAYEKDYAWLGDAITRHYQGDESGVKTLIGGILVAFAGMSVDEYVAAAAAFVRESPHPTLGRGLWDCAFVPMLELLRYLEANGFTTLIASGGDRDFMRGISEGIYAIPPERVIGSSNGLAYEEDEHGGRVVYKREPDYFDDGPAKPVRIWSRIGRRPLIACGNSNGDIPMLRFAESTERPGLRLLLLHDDPEREFAYTAGAEEALHRAADHDWTVVSMKSDWASVFSSVSSG
jgi:phosphoserine phosphatase